ncbi:MAG TPA: hypothetical protein DGF10_02015 [Acidimicrobiaceae bacterium]|nr:hypothetical protein [Acidimicrobiaceae bacterium]HAQ22141.1 hypothetical protein [Acidimicrobiaceae bacterium]HCV33417.1 hypothetical protein [Acidimicrobiaceae bacterium]
MLANMAVRLRQVALVARDLETVETDLVAALGVEACVHDLGVEQFGLNNVLFPVGERLLEVVAPFRSGTSAGRFLDRRGGDGGYMVLFQVDELEIVRERIADLGVRVVLEAVGPGVLGLHLHPSDVGGAIVSVDQTDRWDDWPWAGFNWRDHVRTDVVSDLVTVEVAVVDPESTATLWAALLGLSVDGTTISGDDDGCEVRFIPVSDSGKGVSGLEFRATHHADLLVGGVSMALRPA